MFDGVEQGSRQWEILSTIAKHGSMTLRELADITGLAATPVRHHIDRLVLKGWLDRSRRQGKSGRPADVLSISSECRQQFSQQSAPFAQALVEEIASQMGEDALESMIEGVGRRLMERFPAEMRLGSPRERIERLSEWFAEGGGLNDVTETDDGVTLTLYTCPFHELGGGRRVICDMECSVIRELVGADVTLTCSLPEGGQQCAMEIVLNHGGDTCESTDKDD